MNGLNIRAKILVTGTTVIGGGGLLCAMGVIVDNGVAGLCRHVFSH